MGNTEYRIMDGEQTKSSEQRKIIGKINRTSDIDVPVYRRLVEKNKNGAPYTTLTQEEKLRLAQMLTFEEQAFVDNIAVWLFQRRFEKYF